MSQNKNIFLCQNHTTYMIRVLAYIAGQGPSCLQITCGPSIKIECSSFYYCFLCERNLRSH